MHTLTNHNNVNLGFENTKDLGDTLYTGMQQLRKL